ncbi:MAG: zinc-binding dehydrogenase, partial [Candidatus Binataceae bacterium]
CVLCGVSSSAQATVDLRTLMRAGASLYGFYLANEFARESASHGLARLLALVEIGAIRPQIDLEASWTEIAKVADRLYRQRGITGKAVLTL